MTSPNYHDGNGCQTKTTEKRNVPIKVPELKLESGYNQGELTLIIGKRASGKFTLFKRLYSLIEPKIEEFFVFAKNELFDVLCERYSELTVEKNIFNTIDPKKADDYLNALIYHVKKKPNVPRVGVFDQVDHDLIKSKKFEKIIMNLRHYGITMYIMQQYPLNFGPLYKNAIDNIYYSPTGPVSYEKKVWNLYVSDTFSCYSFEYFNTLTKLMQMQHGILVLSSNKPNLSYIRGELTKVMVKCKTKQITLPPDNYPVSIPYDTAERLKSQLRQIKSLCSQVLDTLGGESPHSPPVGPAVPLG